LPSNMRWISQGITNKKNSIAYEGLEIDLPAGIKTGSGEQLFQYIVDRLGDFLSISSRVPQGDISLGFNFPCPCRRTGPGNGILTKMMCGMYIGEIVRLILVKLNKLKFFLRNHDGRPLLGEEGRWKMNHLHMSSIETDRGITYSSTRRVMAELGLKDVDTETCRVVKKVCEAVTARSASLAGAGLAAIIKRVPRETVSIAIDGSLLRHHPTYRKRLEDSIGIVLKMEPTKLVQRQIFSLKLITDGAIYGAGIAAACYARDRNLQKGFFSRGGLTPNSSINEGRNPI